MNYRCSPLRRLINLLPFLPLATLALPLPAQVPNGWAVVSSVQGPGAPIGGLTLVSPDHALAPIAITGLNTDLTGSGSGQPEGAASVLVNGRTGNLIVGEHCLSGHSSDIHVITLAGNAIATDVLYPLGTVVTSGGWVDQMAWFGDDIVFSVRGNNLTAGPMAGHLLGFVRPELGPPGTPGTVVPIPLTFLPSDTINAMAVDEKHSVLYFATFGTNDSTIYLIPITNTAVAVTPIAVATEPVLIRSLAIDGDGHLLVGCSGGSSSLLRIDVSQTPASVSYLPVSFGSVNGVTVRNATGNMLVADVPTQSLYRLTPGLVATTLGSVPSTPSGVALRQSMARYGQATPNPTAYQWSLGGNPGGLPFIGNLAFSLHMQATPTSLLGVAGLSLGEVDVPVPSLGISLLLDPATLVLPTLLLPANPWVIALPIPNTSGLVGQSVYAQTIHMEANGWATSRGLRTTILP